MKIYTVLVWREGDGGDVGTFLSSDLALKYAQTEVAKRSTASLVWKEAATSDLEEGWIYYAELGRRQSVTVIEGETLDEKFNETYFDSLLVKPQVARPVHA